MLLISVLAIGLVAAAWGLSEAFGLGAREMMSDARDLMQGGTQTGSGDRR